MRTLFQGPLWAGLLITATACGGAPAPMPSLAPAAEAPAAAPATPMWASAERLSTECDAALKTAQTLRDGLVAEAGARTWENTLDPFNRMFLALDTAGGVAAVAGAMSPEKAVREAAEGCEQRLSKFTSDAGLDPALYAAVAALKPQRSARGPQGERFFDKIMRDFRRAGVDRDAATRERLGAIEAELVKLGQDYGRSVREDVRAIELDDASALEGLPEDFIKAHAPGEDGKIRITTDYPDFYPFERYSKDAAQRQALYRKFINRGFPANQKTLQQILTLREEKAKLLGFDTWAAYNAEDKMVKTAARIGEFIEQLAAIVRPVADADLKVLLARKRQDDPKAERIETWDRFFYASKVREEQYAFDARTVRPYFSFPKVKAGLFALYGELFGLRFERLPEAPTWDPSVEAWAMYVEDELAGTFYLDMHPREGKYKHAAVFPMQVGLADGREPRATLVCNFPDPSKDPKALMEHQQVVTFFHEFGHLVHHLLARKSDYFNLGGINVEWDFAEVPSQLLEEWAWDVGVLQRFAKHVDTGEPIPAELVARMVAAKEFGKGVATMRQLFYAAYSYFAHARSPKGLDLDAFSDEMYAKFSPYPAVPDSHIFASFGHLVGYSSMYYTYQWSLVIAKDLFTQFEGKLLDAAQARKYRTLILEPGGGRDAADMVSDFLERPYGMDAYKAWITKPAVQVTPAAE